MTLTHLLDGLAANAVAVNGTPGRIRQVLDRLVVTDAGCWEWSGARNATGHGRVAVNGRFWYVYRLVWTLANGLIPDKHEIHHLCHNSRCSNPSHLECLTHRDHAHAEGLRGIAVVHASRTCCPRGHAYKRSPRSDRRERYCPECHRTRSREWARRKAASSQEAV